MELLQIRYFLEVSRYMNVTNAAAALYTSQPNISASIAKLEKELGIKLFIRKNRKLFLSDAGKAFKLYAERIVREMDSAQLTMDYLKRTDIEQLNVVSFSAGLMPVIIEEFQNRIQDVYLSHQVVPNYLIEDAVLQGKADIGVIAGPPTNTSLEWDPIFEEDLIMLVHKSHLERLNYRGQFEAFCYLPFAGSEMLIDRQLVESICRKAGFTPKFVVSTNEVSPFELYRVYRKTTSRPRILKMSKSQRRSR